jgi:hypothetical protein
LEIQNREKDIGGGGGGDINTDLADVPVGRRISRHPQMTDHHWLVELLQCRLKVCVGWSRIISYVFTLDVIELRQSVISRWDNANFLIGLNGSHLSIFRLSHPLES